MLDVKGKRILVIGAHADDIELGCGGTVAKWIAAGADVTYLTLSYRWPGTPDAYTPTDIHDEVLSAATTLGVPEDQITLEQYPNRHFPRDRQHILDLLVTYRQQVHPDIVLTHHTNDWHQDHQAVAQESIRAFQRLTVFAYELPWNLRTTNHSVFVQLTEEQMQTKIDALQHYQSQLEARPAMFSPDYQRSLAQTRGMQAGCPYAEALECVRLIT